MNIKLKIEELNKMVTPVEMKCGEIGIIRKWYVGEYVGTIVQKHGDGLVSLGQKKGQSFSNVVALTSIDKFVIELLKSGDTIIIE